MVSLSALCPTRASSWSARAGTIASSSQAGAGSSSVVSLTLSRYESVAAITSFSPSKRTRMPVSTGRDSSREADLPDARDRVEKGLALDRERALRLDLREAREVLGRVRVELVRGRSARQARDAFVRAMLERDLAGRKQAHDVDQEASRHDDRALLLDLRLERVAHGDLHVRRAQVEPASGGAKHDPGEDLHARPRRDPPADDLSFSASSSFPQTTRIVVAATVSMDVI